MRQFLEDLSGLSIYPLVSFLLFFAFFLGVFIWMYMQPKHYYTEMKNMPLMEEESDGFSHLARD